LSAKPVIVFDHATISYPVRTALEDVSLQIAEGELIGVIGPNGSGKTTLLKAILGQIEPTSGTVRIFDCSCAELRCHHRARIGYLPQMKTIDPNFPLTVFEAVLMGRYAALGLLHRPQPEDRRIVSRSLEEVGMAEFSTTPLGYLSGGQQQRVFIARALAQQPEVLLLDEPTTGVDAPTQRSILDLIRKLRDTLRLTILLVTHDINMISPIASRLVLLKSRLIAAGPPGEILTRSILTQVYGKEVLVVNHQYVIVEDHHHN
jgi:ABC-type Mn2+/Zn2+ transport system ATPase subunit